MVELGAALPSRRHESGVDQHVDVLGDRLPRRRDLMLGGEPRAELEERLVVAVSEFVEDRTPGGVRQSLENVPHVTGL
jgi:hypothetical protein